MKSDQLQSEIEQKIPVIQKLLQNIGNHVVGQEYLLNRLVLGLVCNQHILIEGVPGLAKTLSVNALSQSLNLSFSRIQFTPDLLPSDLVGTLIYNPKSGDFSTKKGPVFANIVLADEINRAPAKVQSALLEVMQERQVTLGDNSFPLDDPFMVLATQNPIDQEGTYPLPEAQIDRFMMKLIITYPSKEEELQIMERMSHIQKPVDLSPVMDIEEIRSIRNTVEKVFCAPELYRYIIDLVRATREPEEYGCDVAPYISFGASPRASILLALASRAYAMMQGRGFVIPEDIREIALDILRHRIILSYEADAEEVSTDTVIGRILETLIVP